MKQIEDLKVFLFGVIVHLRKFLYIEDMAEAIMLLDKKTYHSRTSLTQSHINVGMGRDISILNLAELIKATIGYKGALIFDKNKPSGISKKLLDVTLIKSLGWKPKVKLKTGLIKTYDWYLKNYENLRK